MHTKTAADVMTTPVVTVEDSLLLTEAIKVLLRHHISGMPVVDAEGHVVGILTEHDIMNFAFSGDADTTCVREAMTSSPVSFSPETPLPTIVNAFACHKWRRVPILDGDHLVGIVSRRDVLREMLYFYTNRYGRI